MSIDTSTIQKIIVDGGLLTAEQFNELVEDSKKSHQNVEDVLIERGILDQQKLLEIKGDVLNVPVVDLKRQKIPKEILNIIPEPIARRHSVVAFAKAGDELHLAMLDPDDLQIREFIKKTTGLQVRPFLTTKESIDFGVTAYHSNLEEEFKNILSQTNVVNADLSNLNSEEFNEKLATIAEQIPIVRIVDTLLEYAVYEKASDIHLEPQDDSVIVRYRIDGVLHDVMTLPKMVLPAVVARVKVLSNLKIDEHRLPQDGRFKKDVSDSRFSFRVSTIPVFDGEKIVMRLLDESSRALSLADLGFQGEALAVVERNLAKPHGALLVTGPTGSGKSTTLYSMISLLNKREVNISTIEDPIEYRIEGVNQMQVNPKIGLTFAIGLRSLLRQDPNVIMIGEIRDRETAEEAVHAAMTGHIVLSTLHTNSAAGALPRLTDMNVEPFLISSTVNVIVAQRLTRRLCRHCMASYNLEDKRVKELESLFDLEDLMASLIKNEIVSKSTKSIKDVLFFRSSGCDKCGNTGYKGRNGIYEVLEVTPEISGLIMNRAPSKEIEAKAKEQGMVAIWQDGFIKAHLGVTTIEEVIRVSAE